MRHVIQYWTNKLTRVTSNGAYISEIDGLRFMAILPVIFQHLSERLIRYSGAGFNTPVKEDQLVFMISRGTVGVFLFFAISGFILALPFAAYKLGVGKPITLKKYFLRRVTRLEPPYLIWMLFFAFILVVKGTISAAALLPHLLCSLTYTHNIIYGYYSPINPVAWSLEIEIQFYLIAPLLTAIFFSISDKKIRRWSMVAFIALWVSLAHYFGWSHFPLKATLLGQLQHFMVGMFVADIYLSERKALLQTNRIWDIIAPVAMVFMMYTWTEEYLKSLIFMVALTSLFIAGFKGPLLRSFLRNKMVAIIGGMCYTIYLIHLPLLEMLFTFTHHLHWTNYFLANFLLQCLIALPIIFILSAIFFLLLEKPFMVSNWYKSIQLSTMLQFIKSPFMKVKNKWLTAILLVLMATQPLFSQSVALDSLEAVKVSKVNLKPVEELINIALQHSPMLNVNSVTAEEMYHAWQVQKKSWTDLVGVSGAVIYGNGSVFDANNDGVTTQYFTTDRKNINFNVSLNVRLTGGDLFNRNEKTEIKRLEYEKVKEERKEIENAIREVVITRYRNLQLAIKLVSLKAEGLENQRIALEVAEEYFKKGNLAVSEYSTILAKTTSAEEEYEVAKNKSIECYMLLKEVVGGPIDKTEKAKF